MTQTHAIAPASLRHIAQNIAESASAVAMQHFRNPLGIEFKEDESPVTMADRAVEAHVRDLIADHYPEHGIFGEEQGISAGTTDDMWIVDPIDGTRSFITGHPLFGFLLAKLTGGQSDLAVIGMPAIGETYIAERSGGVWRDGKRLRSSDLTAPDDCTIYINEGEKIWRSAPDLFARVMNCGRTRRFSYDCYPYALLAAGHVDVVIDADLQPYDYLPVSLIVEESGGCMSDWSGGALKMGHNVNTIAASTPELHARMLKVIQS